jgi:hypothetical protein
LPTITFKSIEGIGPELWRIHIHSACHPSKVIFSLDFGLACIWLNEGRWIEFGGIDIEGSETVRRKMIVRSEAECRRAVIDDFTLWFYIKSGCKVAVKRDRWVPEVTVGVKHVAEFLNLQFVLFWNWIPFSARNVSSFAFTFFFISRSGLINPVAFVVCYALIVAGGEPAVVLQAVEAV